MRDPDGGGTANPPYVFVPDSAWQPDAAAIPLVGNFVHFESDEGDTVAAGEKHTYTQADAVFVISAVGGILNVEVRSDGGSVGQVAFPGRPARLAAGRFSDIQAQVPIGPTNASLNWIQDGKGCGGLGIKGWVEVDSVSYLGDELTAIEFRFEQHCVGSRGALRGKVRWKAADVSPPPGPIEPVPDALWQLPAHVTPASESYIVLQSDEGDYIGQGRTYSYTPGNAKVSIGLRGGHLAIWVLGEEIWSGHFQAMDGQALLRPGYYPDVNRYVVFNPAKGGMDWSGERRGCNRVAGWFAVDDVKYEAGTLKSIDLRFEQHCERAAASLRGRVRWVVDKLAVPTDVAAGTGNFVYLQSGYGDFIGVGGNYLHTPQNSVISATSSGAHLSVIVQGYQHWRGEFKLPDSHSQLTAGTYLDLSVYPVYEPSAGGLRWSGDGRDCGRLQGWIAIDEVTYRSGMLQSIDLRFEQYCEVAAIPLRGRIRWSADDTRPPPGPQWPIPGLWRPPANAVPAGGSHVYLESQPGDYVGQGRTILYTVANSNIFVSGTAGHLKVRINDIEWSGDFQAMTGQTALVRGYYANVNRYPLHNPAVGGLNWSGQGRGCNRLTGWFAIDDISYVGDTLQSVDLRFEQHCENDAPVLNGRVKWVMQ